MPTVRSTDKPAPTLTTGCLAMPPSQYTPRHDDAGSLGEAHVLSIDDAARIASFPSGYFGGMGSRRGIIGWANMCNRSRVAEGCGEQE